MADPLDFLYEVGPDEKRPFGKHWCFEGERFEHGKLALVAKYEGKSDGHNVEVFCVAMPARFFKVVVAPRQAYNGPRQGFTLNTGSDMGHLAADIAEALAGGMLGLDVNAETKVA